MVKCRGVQIRTGATNGLIEGERRPAAFTNSMATTSVELCFQRRLCRHRNQIYGSKGSCLQPSGMIMVRTAHEGEVPTDGTPFTLDSRLGAVTHPLLEWPLSSVRLMNDARWPWLILVPRVAGMRDLVDLDEKDQATLWSEIARCSLALRATYAPYKLNVAALGNVVAQLHVHVIARFEADSAWPAPVWGHGVAEPYTEAALAALRRELVAALNLA